MNEEKQIEEIRNEIFAAFGGYAKWEEDWQSLAEAVYNAGYRKQSEVAAEIFAKIRQCWARRLFDCDDFSCKDFAFEDFAGDLDELYKKYMGDQT